MAAHVGVRVDDESFDRSGVALQLASAAAERGVAPIVFSSVPQSGFEEFGFRIERVPPPSDPTREAMESELRAFWNIAVVIDASDVQRLR